MTDLVLAVRVTADGAQVVGQLSQVQTEALQTKGAFEQTAQGARALDAATDAMGRSAGQAAGQERELANAAAYLRSQLDPMYAAQQRFDQELRIADQLMEANVISTREYASAQQLARQRLREHSQQIFQTNSAHRQGTNSARAQSAAYQQLGFQVQDITQQMALGVNPLVIMAQQGGQTASAIAMMGNSMDGTASRAVRFARFLSGPWGAALFGAATIVGFLTQSLLSNRNAANEAEDAGESLADSQLKIRDYFDVATGAILEQNRALIENRIYKNQERLDQIGDAATARAAEARRLVDSSARSLVGNTRGGGFLIPEGTVPANPDLVRGFRAAGSQDARLAFLANLARSGSTNAGAASELLQLYADAATEGREAQQLIAFTQSLQNGRLDPSLIDAPNRRTPRSRSGADSLANFGESAAERVRRISEQFDDAPREIDRSVQSVRELDRIMVELASRRPPGFQATIDEARLARQAVLENLGDPIEQIASRFDDIPRDVERAVDATRSLDGIIARLNELEPPGFEQFILDAEAAKRAVEESLARPFRELIRDQERSFAVQRLQIQGRNVEAAQLEQINRLMDQFGATNAGQLAIELQRRGIRAEEFQQLLDNIGAQEELSEQMKLQQGFLQDQLGVVGQIRDLSDKAIEDFSRNGIAAIETAGEGLLNIFSQYQARFLSEQLFGGIFRRIEDTLSGEQDVRDARRAEVSQIGAVVRALESLERAANSTADAVEAEIIVQGRRPAGEDEARDPFDVRLRSPRELFREIFAEFGSEVFGEELAQEIGDKVAVALQGAILGQGAAGTVFGSEANKTGSAIGGAAGSVIGDIIGKEIGGAFGQFAGPLGSIAGGLLGSIAANAFTSTKRGSATITSADGDASSRGNSGRLVEASLGLVGTVQENINRIAEVFGFTPGTFSTSLGVRKDNIRFDPTGQGITKTKKGAIDFGDDEAGAIAAATLDAIRDMLANGSARGLSAAVAQALSSSPDIEAAISEALKVREVEELLDGLLGDLTREFKTFENQAAERVRIARQYGFDVVEIEKRNAEDRAKLIEDILQERVGSLQDLLDNLNFGDLFEGSAADRRDALRAEIAKAEADAEQGVDGAARKLADLNRQLIDLTRNAFGTAGPELGSDIERARSSAERIIEIENERIREAQEAARQTNAHLAESNRLAGEGNGFLSEIATSLFAIRNGGVGYVGGTGGGSGNSGIARNTDIGLR